MNAIGPMCVVLRLLYLIASNNVAVMSDQWANEIEQQLTNARTATVQSLNLMHQRWEFDSPRLQYLLVAANFPAEAWDILKFKFAKKYVGKLQKKGAHETSFLMIFGGSSVTASRDNYYNQSYPKVCERRMRASFDALGVPLLIRNIAHANSPCRPSNLCYNSMGGDNADWMLWEQSFNCGRDKGIFEIMTRIAWWNKAVLYFSASGGFSPGHCPRSNDSVPWISEQWLPENEPLFKRNHSKYHLYAPNQTAVLAFRSLSNAFFEENNSGGRFAMANPYKGMAAHGFSVWARSNKLCKNDINGKIGCSAVEIMGDCQGKQGGVHWMTKEAGTYGAGRGDSYHPTWGIHVKRGEFIAYNILHAFLDAVYMLEHDLKASVNLTSLAEQYEQELNKLQNFSLPEPMICGFECRTKPICHTDFLPHHNSNYTLARVIINSNGGKIWKRWVQNPPLPSMGYQDYQFFYETNEKGVELNLRVNVSLASPYLRVCATNQKDSLKHAVFLIDPNMHIGMNSTYVPSINRVTLSKRQYVGNECTLLTELPSGHHVLSIMLNPNVTNARAVVSHIVMYE